MTDRERIEMAFEALRAEGFTAEMDFLCCTGCGLAELHGRVPDGAPWVFYHRQDEEGAFGRYYVDDDDEEGAPGGGQLQEGLYLTFGSDPAAGRKICAAIQAAGLYADWNGEMARKIEVSRADPTPSPETVLTAVREAG